MFINRIMLLRNLIKKLKLYPWRIETEYIRSYIIQFTIFFYGIYRYMSRSYESYGFLNKEVFIYNREWLKTLYPVPVLHFTSFQFIYDFIPRPSAYEIRNIQYLIIIFLFFGLIGIFPRINSFLSFLLCIHIEGFIQSSEAEISGGTLLLISLLLISLTPKDGLYKLGKVNKLSNKSASASVLVFNFSLFLGFFYFQAGLNKLITYGPMWPFFLRSDLFIYSQIERQFDLFRDIYFEPNLLKFQTSSLASHINGLFTLASELLSILFITQFKYKYLIVSFLILMHIFIYFLLGINFIGSCLLLLCILDWGALVRKIEIPILKKNKNQIFHIIIIKKYIKPFNIYFRDNQISKANEKLERGGYSKNKSCFFIYSNKERKIGFDAISTILLRSRFFIFGIILHLPFINIIINLIYRKIVMMKSKSMILKE